MGVPWTRVEGSPVVIGTEACDEDLKDFRGWNYRGCQTKTVNGARCQAWNKQTPHTHSVSLDKILGEEAKSWGYCRNPDNTDKEKGLWCYTTDSNTRSDYCEPKFSNTRVGIRCVAPVLHNGFQHAVGLFIIIF